MLKIMFCFERQVDGEQGAAVLRALLRFIRRHRNRIERHYRRPETQRGNCAPS